MSKKTSSKKVDLTYQPTLTKRGVEKLQALFEKLGEKNPAIKKVSVIKAFLLSGSISDLKDDQSTVFKILDDASSTDLKGLFVGRKFQTDMPIKELKKSVGMDADKIRKLLNDELRVALKNAGQQGSVESKTGKKTSGEKEEGTISLVVKKSNAMTNKDKIAEKAQDLLTLIQGGKVDELSQGALFTSAKDDVLKQLLKQGSTVEELAEALGGSIEGSSMQERINWLNENFKEQFVRCFLYLLGGSFEKMAKVKGKEERVRRAKDSKTVYKHVVKSVSPIKSIDFGLTVPKAPSLYYLKRINEFYDGRDKGSTEDERKKEKESADAKKAAGSDLNFLKGKTVENYVDAAESIKANPEVALYFNALRTSVTPKTSAEKNFISNRKDRIEEGRKTKELKKEGNIKRLSSTKTNVGSFFGTKEICDTSAFKAYVEKLSLQNVPKSEVCKMYKITVISEKIHDLETVHQAEWDGMSPEARNTYASIVADILTSEILGESGYESLDKSSSQKEVQSTIQQYLPRLYMLRQVFLKGGAEDNKRTKEILVGNVRDISEEAKEGWFGELKERLGVTGEYSDSLLNKKIAIEIKKKKSSAKKSTVATKKKPSPEKKKLSSEKKKLSSEKKTKPEEEEENPFGEFSAQARKKAKGAYFNMLSGKWELSDDEVAQARKKAKGRWDEEESESDEEVDDEESEDDWEAMAKHGKKSYLKKAKTSGRDIAPEMAEPDEEEAMAKHGKKSPPKKAKIHGMDDDNHEESIYQRDREAGAKYGRKSPAKKIIIIKKNSNMKK